jgi:hypothetical protein
MSVPSVKHAGEVRPNSPLRKQQKEETEMNQFRNWAIALLGALALSVIGCGAPDESGLDDLPSERDWNAVVDTAGQIDGEPLDGQELEMFELAEQYRFLFPDDGPMIPAAGVKEIVDAYEANLKFGSRDIGRAQQAWHSAEYYGIADTTNGPCFSGATGGNSNCQFPTYLTARYTNIGNCTGPEPFIPGTNIAVTRAMQQDIYGGMYDAIRTLYEYGNDGFVVAIDNERPGISANRINVTLACDNNTSVSNFGSFAFPPGTFRQSKLGRGPNSLVDEGYAMQYTGGRIRLAPANILMANAAPSPGLPTGCAVTPSGTAGSVSDRVSMGRYVGTHEVMHSLGWAHFVNGIMNPVGRCKHLDTINEVLNAVTPEMLAAFQIYSGGFQTSNGTIHDVNLENPCNHVGGVENGICESSKPGNQ